MGWCLYLSGVFLAVCSSTSLQAQSGKLAGYWENTTFGSFGPVILYVDISLTEISLRLETEGPQDGIPPFELTSPLRNTGGSAKIAGHPELGNVDGSITLMGDIDIKLDEVPHERIMAGSAMGKFDFEKLTLTLDYRIRFRTETPEDQLVEGVDFSLGKVSASTEAEPRFEYIYPRPMGDDLKTLTVGKDGSGATLLIAGGHRLIAHSGESFRETTFPPEVRLRTFLGVAYDGSGWAAFDDRGQTYRSADGIRWDESGRLPEDADYLDIASGTEPGRFTFVGMKGRLGEYALGRWAEALTPVVEWTVPGEPDLHRAIAVGRDVYVGGSTGTIVHWQGSAASAVVESIPNADTISDLALGSSLLVATTVTTGTTTGLTYKRPRDGGDWESAGLAKNFLSVVYNPTTSQFLLSGPNGFYSIYGDDLGEPELTRFSTWPQLQAAAVGDHFYATGTSGTFARIAADGTLTEFHERPFEWPFYDMARVADQLLMFSRFGRVFNSADFANSFKEQRIFSGFSSPSPRTSVHLPDGRLLLFTDERPAVALTSDGLTWETITPLLTPEGGATAPFVRTAAINNAGLILAVSLRQGDSTVLTTTPENPQVFESLGRDFFNPVVSIVATQERFLRAGKSFQMSLDGRTWTTIPGSETQGNFTTVYYDEPRGFGIAGTSTGRLYRSAFPFDSAVEVLSPVTSEIVDMTDAGDGRIALLTKEGKIALTSGGDFQLFDQVDGTFFGLYYDEVSKSLFAHGTNGVLARYQIEPVAVPLTGWEKWRADHFEEAQLANESVSGPFADPDGDGNWNVFEFGTNGDPWEYDPPVALRPFSDEDQLGTFVGFDLRLNAGIDELFRFETEVSGDDGQWINLGETRRQIEGEEIRLVHTEDTSTEGRLGRLRIIPRF